MYHCHYYPYYYFDHHLPVVNARQRRLNESSSHFHRHIPFVCPWSDLIDRLSEWGTIIIIFTVASPSYAPGLIWSIQFDWVNRVPLSSFSPSHPLRMPLVWFDRSIEWIGYHDMGSRAWLRVDLRYVYGCSWRGTLGLLDMGSRARLWLELRYMQDRSCTRSLGLLDVGSRAWLWLEPCWV